MDEIIEDIQNFLSSKDIKKTLMLNFKETVEQYINYVNKNGQLNLNNINIF